MDFNLLSNDIAIDLGSSNTRIYIKGRGLVLDEPSVIAYEVQSGDIIAAGGEAYKMLGRNPASIGVSFPISGGVISDCMLAEELLKNLLRRVCPKTLIKPRMILSVPCGVTDVEKRALRDAAVVAGARRVYIMEAPIAAAIGAGCDVSLARGLMVGDIGGGSFDISAISLWQSAASLSSKDAGTAMTDALISYLRDRYYLSVGFQSAEECKCTAGCVFTPEEAKTFTISGQDIRTGLVGSVTVSSDEIKDALSPVCDSLADSIRLALDKTPGELCRDIMEDGILLTGGAANIPGLIPRLRVDTDLKIFLAPEGSLCTVRGLAAAIENIDTISKDSYMLYQG